MVRAAISTSFEVQSVKILDGEKRSEGFVVSFLVDQKITEGKKTQEISSAYRVTVFEDKKRNQIVTSLPTMVGKPEKAEYEAKRVESDSEIAAKTTDEITEFLETFFKPYPTVSEKELEYHVENDAVRPINSNLKFVELVSPVYQQKDEEVQGEFTVRYLDDIGKVTSIYQYNVHLMKGDNWKIISCN